MEGREERRRKGGKKRAQTDKRKMHGRKMGDSGWPTHPAAIKSGGKRKKERKKGKRKCAMQCTCGKTTSLCVVCSCEVDEGVSLSVSLSLCLSVCLSVCLSLSVSVCLSLSHQLSLSFLFGLVVVVGSFIRVAGNKKKGMQFHSSFACS